MLALRNFPILRTIPVLIAVCILSFPVHAKCSGGKGERNDPQQIARAADLILTATFGPKGEGSAEEATYAVHSDLASFSAAAPGPILTQNLDGYLDGTDLAGVELLPGLSVTSNMSTIQARRKSGSRDTNLFGYDDTTRKTGEAYYDINLFYLYTAVSFDVEAWNPEAPGPAVVEISFRDGRRASVQWYQTGPTEQTPVFFGITSDTPIARIRWNEGPEIYGAGNEETALDNFAVSAALGPPGTMLRYSGGSGTPDDPYRIAIAEDLILLGQIPDDYDKHFILTADLDLDPNLPGRKVFDRAVIAPHIADPNGLFLVGTPFSGVFDGHGHAISHLTIEGEGYIGLFGKLDSGARISSLGLDAVDVNGDGSYVGGLVGSVGEWYGADIIVANCYCTGSVSGAYRVGGLVGTNGGSITSCYSTGSVSGESNVGALVGGNSGLIASSYSSGLVSGERIVGGLAGINWGSITSCSSSASVTGDSYGGGLVGTNGGSITASYCTGSVSGNDGVGGLVGDNDGIITSCYSTGSVTGNHDVGGLVGDSDGSITASFWDMETSGQPTSAGGAGLTTSEMQDIDTYLSEGWDCADEVRNGTCDYWQMSTGDYPRLQYGVDADPVMPEGLGTAEQPYLIRDANDLGTVWFKPTAHYRLEMSLDLSGTMWPMAVVPWFDGTFEGNGHVIRNLHIQGGGVLGLFGQLGFAPSISNLGLEAVDVNGTGGHVGGLMSGFIDPWRGGDIIVANCYSTGSVSGVDSVGGLVGDICFGNITSCYSTCSVTGDSGVGGLVGWNLSSTIATSYCTGSVSGNDGVGGLVGDNDGIVTSCYSMGSACGRGPVGGLVGRNEGTIGSSYSTGSVTGDWFVGGLVGYNDKGTIISSFWDIESSGATESPGGTGLTTPEMQTASTFLDAGWDFIDETENGTDDIWWIREGRDYPRLWWKHSMSFWAFSPRPPHGATDVTHIPTLSWRAGEQVVRYDVYFGDYAEAVASVTTETPGIYRGRQSAEKTTYDPGVLELNRTYYWRIDGVIEGEWDNPRKGQVWSFTTADYLVVTVLDDFESYSDALEGDSQVSQMWIDGPANGTIGLVSLELEKGVVHDGRQAMRFTYWNVVEPWHAQAERLWQTPQNWTLNEADTLTLYVRGARKNDPEPLYVAIEDASGQIGLVTHPDADAVRATEWQKWHVALADLQGQGMDVALVKRMIIGVGDENDRQYKRLGTIYVDDIRLTSRMQ